MLILTAAQNAQPDYVALAMVVALAIIVAIMAIRKKAGSKIKKPEPVVITAAPEVIEKPVAPGAAGQLKIHNVEPKVAAMLMAIVADKMGKPLNELRFISIKEAE